MNQTFECSFPSSKCDTTRISIITRLEGSILDDSWAEAFGATLKHVAWQARSVRSADGLRSG